LFIYLFTILFYKIYLPNIYLFIIIILVENVLK
jgi:hypothetical protein